MYAFIGTDAAAHGDRHGEAVLGKQRIEIRNDDTDSVDDVFADITATTDGIVKNHIADGAAPLWVSSDNDELADRLAGYYGIEKRRFLPAGEREEHRERPFVTGILGPVVGMMLAVLLLSMLGRFYLRTNAGTDWQSDLMGSVAGVPAKYMALSATSGESAAHTALAGEITTAGGGLIRKAATYAHTTGTSTYTQTATFTANGTDALPVTVKQVGLLTASSAGVLAFEKIIADTPYVSVGDAATITYTITP